MLTPEEQHILEHATAWRHRRPLYRNHFCGARGSDSWPTLLALRARGLVETRNVTTITVGAPFVPGRTRWPEAAHYNYSASGHQLALFLASPSADEVEAVRVGPSEFALYATPPLVVLAYRFGTGRRGLPWSDAPYSWHLVPEAERALPPPVDDAGPEVRATVQVLLVDAATGLLRAIRVVSWSPRFTAAIHRAIVEQSQGSWGVAAYDRALDALYRRGGTEEAIVAFAAVRTKGGA